MKQPTLAANKQTDSRSEDVPVAEYDLSARPSSAPSAAVAPRHLSTPSPHHSPPSAVTNTLWREWRNTDDEEYARHLFDLLGETLLEDEAHRIYLMVGASYGALAGALVGLLLVINQVSPELLLGILSVTVGALLGSAVAWLQCRLEPDLTWQKWLARLTFHLSPKELGVIAVVFAMTFLNNAIGSMAVFMVWLEATVLLLTMVLSLKLVGWMLSYYREPNPANLSQYRRLWVWWRDRPNRLEVEDALRWLSLDTKNRTWDEVLTLLEQRKQSPDSVREMIIQLQSLDWQERFVAAHLLVTTGGEAVAELQVLAAKITSPLHKKALRLLHNIGQETAARLAEPAQTLLCPHCLTRTGQHTIEIDTTEILFYGCRTCRQSRKFLSGHVVAVLDSASSEVKPQNEGGLTRINWLPLRKLFDFDRVEIIQAIDEEVERFAVQVGNDTDPARTATYSQMVCVVHRSCPLSPNSRRVLARIFGEVRDV